MFAAAVVVVVVVGTQLSLQREKVAVVVAVDYQKSGWWPLQKDC